MGSFTSVNWAREQQLEFECNACIRYILLGCPPELPPDILDDVQLHRRTPFDDIKALADQGRCDYDNGLCLFVRKPSKAPTAASGRPGGRFARPLNDEPIRLYVPMRMRPWVMLAIHASALCHVGAVRTPSLLKRFYWWVGTNEVTRFGFVNAICVKRARPLVKLFVGRPSLSPCPLALVSPSALTILARFPRGNSYILLLIDRFSRRANMYAVTDAQFTAKGTADILVNKYMTVWGCPISILSDNGKQFRSLECSRAPRVHYWRLGLVVQF